MDLMSYFYYTLSMVGNEEMIEIDGSYGEGGGQIVRTSLGLSGYSNKAFKVNNIRANRSNPGLSHQHVKCVEVMKEIMDADVRGNELRSKKLIFCPNKVDKTDLEVDIGTAGSISLLIQCILPIISKIDSNLRLEVKGGTDVKWSPPINYLEEITLFFLKKMGLNCSLEIKKRGYYPKGQGKVVFEAKPGSINKFSFKEKGELIGIEGISFSSNLPHHVAERQKNASIKALNELDEEINVSIERDPKATGKGSGVFLFAKTTNSRLGGSSLGEPGKPAEEVGEEAAEKLLRSLKKNGCVDKYSCDQLIPFLGIAEGSEISGGEITSHTKTNAWVVSNFLDTEINFKEERLVTS